MGIVLLNHLHDFWYCFFDDFSTNLFRQFSSYEYKGFYLTSQERVQFQITLTYSFISHQYDPLLLSDNRQPILIGSVMTKPFTMRLNL